MSYAEIKAELKLRYNEFVANKRSKSPQTSNALLPSEGDLGTYEHLDDQGERFDNITPHHMPASKYMSSSDNIPPKFRLEHEESLAMNLEQIHPGAGGRHRRTFTYGMSGRNKELYLALKPRDALAFDILDVRRILIEDGVYDSFMRGQLRKHIDSYETLLPEIFLKK
ncbi:MAG TPA: hypothetical protein VHP38_08635 [Ruminiclostridium sp.]|nr:hypothetical protein [Ruminiclostridium sp.]